MSSTLSSHRLDTTTPPDSNPSGSPAGSPADPSTPAAMAPSPLAARPAGSGGDDARPAVTAHGGEPLLPRAAAPSSSSTTTAARSSASGGLPTPVSHTFASSQLPGQQSSPVDASPRIALPAPAPNPHSSTSSSLSGSGVPHGITPPAPAAVASTSSAASANSSIASSSWSSPSHSAATAAAVHRLHQPKPKPAAATPATTHHDNAAGEASDGDDVSMRSPSPSPARPLRHEAITREVPFGNEGGEEDGDDDDDDAGEPPAPPTAAEIDMISRRLEELFAQVEVGQSGGSTLREVKSLIEPILPTLQTLPQLHYQLDSQSETIGSLRRLLEFQSTLNERAALESRLLHNVERQGWEVSTRVLLEKTSLAHQAQLTQQSKELAAAAASHKHPRTGPSQSRKESGFDKIETVDTEDYDKLIKKWLELQAENRRNGLERTAMAFKIRDSETQIKALTDELHFLRTSAMCGSGSYPLSGSSTSAANPSGTPAPSGSARPRQTLGDARSEHLLLAAKRLRSLRRVNPEIGLITANDYAVARLDFPEELRVPPQPLKVEASSVGGAGAGAGGDGVWVAEDDASTPKGKPTKGRKKAAALTVNTAAAGPSSVASSSQQQQPPKTPLGKGSPRKRIATGGSQIGDTTPGGSHASFDDLLLAAQSVFSRPQTNTVPPTSTLRGRAAGDDGEEELDELDSTSEEDAVDASPKRRRTAPNAWVQDTAVNGHDSSQQPNPEHASALDLLALASFGSSDPVGPAMSHHLPSTPSSSSRLGGLMGLSSSTVGGPPPSHPHPSGGSAPNTPRAGLEAPFVLRAAPAPSANHQRQQQLPRPMDGHAPSSSPSQAFSTPARPQQSQASTSTRNIHSSPVTYQPDTPSFQRVKDEEGFISPAGSHAASAASLGGEGAGAVGLQGSPPVMPARRVRSPYLKWSTEEDELLARGVAKYGQKWDMVSKAVPTRSYHQCRQRWLRKLGVFDHKPNIDATNTTSALLAQSPLKRGA